MTLVIILLSSLGVILWWRGIWELADIYLFPKNHKASLWAGALIGVVLSVVAAVLAYIFRPDLLGL